MSKLRRYYGLNTDLEIVKNGYVNILDALKIIDDRFDNQKELYETVEEATADTMFGFGDDGGDEGFVEICLMGKHPNSFKFEYTRRRINLFLFSLPLISSFETDYRSIDLVKEKVSLFFEQTPDEFAETMLHDGAKKT